MKRIFVDSSVLFAAAYSAQDNVRDLINLGIQRKIQLVTSSLVMGEMRRNLAGHAPETFLALALIFNAIPFQISNPSKEAVIEACLLSQLADAPVLAAAKAARVGVLVTLDRQHLLDRPDLAEFVDARILPPAEAYKWVMLK